MFPRIGTQGARTAGVGPTHFRLIGAFPALPGRKNGAAARRSAETEKIISEKI